MTARPLADLTAGRAKDLLRRYQADGKLIPVDPATHRVLESAESTGNPDFARLAGAPRSALVTQSKRL